MSKRELDIASLTREERLDLLEELWDRLGATPEAILLTEAQRAELDRRLGDLELEGPVGIPWDELLGRYGARRCTGMRRMASAGRKSSANDMSTRPRKSRRRQAVTFVVCVENSGYPALLERHKIYRVLPDQDAAREGDLRVVGMLAPGTG